MALVRCKIERDGAIEEGPRLGQSNQLTVVHIDHHALIDFNYWLRLNPRWKRLRFDTPDILMHIAPGRRFRRRLRRLIIVVLEKI